MGILHADWLACWSLVWRRDNPYRPGGTAMFDTTTGRVLWLTNDEGDPINDAAMAEILIEPSRYEEIPPLDHGDHHEIFRAWLESEVSEDVRNQCNVKSIGGFFDTLGPSDMREQWQEFHDAALRERATAWLRNRGWQVEWM